MSRIDEEGMKRVAALIGAVKGAGLDEAAELFETVYWAWLRTTEAYTSAHPYVDDKDHHPRATLSIVDYTLRHWSPQIPGTPTIDDDAVRHEADIDAAWHFAEDRRMRRAAGECIS